MFESEPGATIRVGEKSGSSEAMATIREPYVTRRVHESQEGTSEAKKEKIWVSWKPSSSEDGSESGSEREVEEKMSNETMSVLPLEDWGLLEPIEEEDRALLPQIQEAIDIMLGDAVEPAAAVRDNLKRSTSARLALGEGLQGLGAGSEGLSVGADAIPENRVRLKELVGTEDVAEAAELDKRNF